MRTYKVLIILIAIIIAIPFAGRLFWSLKKSRTMDLLIINKTVPKPSMNEVKSFNWVLNSGKILKTNNSHYNYSNDYYGLYPDDLNKNWKIKSFKLEDLESLNDRYEGVVFLDNTGVSLQDKKLAANYGGLNQNDYLLLRNMLNNNKLVILESDFFSNQTDDLIRYNTEQLIDVYNVGWKGKFFNRLDEKNIKIQIGDEWLDIYKDYYKSNWNFQGSGLIIINEKHKRILVLPSKDFMNKDYPEVTTENAFMKEMNLPKKAVFTGWFDIVHPGKNTVVSYFNMNLNEAGIDILKNNGLDPVFPATIKSPDNQMVFIAGDFSKQKIILASSRVMLMSNVIHGVCRYMPGNPGFFFQNYYVPFMSCILDDYYNISQI